MRKVAGDVKWKWRKSSWWLTALCSQRRQTSLRVGDIKYVFIKRLFLIPHNIKLIQGFTISFWRNRPDRMWNRFCASFRMAENAKRTPELTRKVKNCNVPRNKIKSAIFWQKSYRLEWYLIICHYLNLYVHCISFITRLFLLWKLTGAKSNFENMCLQERNLLMECLKL